MPQALAPLIGRRAQTAQLVDGRPVSVWPSIAGQWADDRDRKQWSQAAALLASLHRALALAAVADRPSRSWPSADVPEVEDPRLTAWIEEFLRRRPRHQPLHADFHAGNMLARNGKIVALLDWDEALIGPPELELAWAAWEWGGGLWAEDLTGVTEFVDAYRAAGGPASDLRVEDLRQLVRARLQAEVRYDAATERTGTLPDNDRDYRARQIEVFHRLA